MNKANEIKTKNNNYANYLNNFFLENDITEKEQQLYISLVNKLENYDKSIVEWDNYDLDEFMLGLRSKSANSIAKTFQYVKNIYNYICGKEEVIAKNLYLIHAPKYYIDKRKLRNNILTKQQYNHFRKILTVTDINNDEYNYRDKVLVELAWEGLTSNEIKNLKINDILFEDRDSGKIAKIKLEDRDVIITDPEVVKDIIQTIKHDKYYVHPRNRRKAQYISLRDTEYLIRAVKTNVGKRDTVSNPSGLLKNVLAKEEMEDSVMGVDLSRISLEDIRRSRVVDMMQNGVSNEEVANFLGKKTTCDIYWLEEIALALKREEEKMND